MIPCWFIVLLMQLIWCAAFCRTLL